MGGGSGIEAPGGAPYRFFPVPECPGRLTRFRGPDERALDVAPRPRGASGFDPFPRPDAGALAAKGARGASTSPVLSDVVRVRLRDAVPRARPPRPPPPPPMVSSAASRASPLTCGLPRPLAVTDFWIRAMQITSRHVHRKPRSRPWLPSFVTDVTLERGRPRTRRYLVTTLTPADWRGAKHMTLSCVHDEREAQAPPVEWIGCCRPARVATERGCFTYSKRGAILGGQAVPMLPPDAVTKTPDAPLQ